MNSVIFGRSMELDLYQVDLAAIVSEFIDETEKNLRALLDQQGLSDALLFFDEASALFGRATPPFTSTFEVAEIASRLQLYGGVVLMPDRVDSRLSAFLRFRIDRRTLLERLSQSRETAADASRNRIRQGAHTETR